MKNYSVCFCFAVLVAGTADAGVVFEFETTDHSGAHGDALAGSATAFVEGRDLKMSIRSGSGRSDGEMIFRGGRNEMIMVDHEDRSYIVIDAGMMASIGNKLSSVEAQMREALKDVPPEQRAMVEQMMKQRMPKQNQAATRPAIEIKRTSEKGSKGGYPCVKYEMLRGGQKVLDMWVTDWGNVPGGDEAVDAFDGMSAFFREMRESLPDFAQGADTDGNPFGHLKEIDGFPVVTLDYAANGTLRAETVLSSSTKQSLEPGEFKPPANYRRQQTPGL